MTTKGHPSPGNLKDRIAALNASTAQANANDRPTSPSPIITPGPSGSPVAGPNSAGLRDKIARFEKKGGVPVPRGSFGLGAPPLAENAPLKRRGELYGNRIPTVRSASIGTSSRASSPSPFEVNGRTVSMSFEGGDGDGIEYPPSSPSSVSTSSPTKITAQDTGSSIGHARITPHFTGSALVPQYTGNREAPRSTAFATALELARKKEADAQLQFAGPGPRESSPAPVNGTVKETKAVEITTEPASTSTPTTESPPSPASSTSIPSQPDPVPSIAAQPPQKQVLSPLEIKTATVIDPAEPISPPAPEPVTSPQASTPVIVLSSSDEKGEPVLISEPEKLESPEASTTDSPKPEPSSDNPSDTPSDTGSSQSILPLDFNDTLVIPPLTVPVTPSPPPTPLGPFTLANAVHDLGKVVANIQDMFPGQISPIPPPTTIRPLTFDPPPTTTNEAKHKLKAKKSVVDLQLKLDASTPTQLQVQTASQSIPAVSGHAPPRVPATSSVATAIPRPSVLNVSRGNARPISMFETSPSHVAFATRITGAAATPVVITGAGNTTATNDSDNTSTNANASSQKPSAPTTTKNSVNNNKYAYFPPTPEPDVSEFGSITLGHKSSRSVSHAHARSATDSAGLRSAATSTFSAVVHKKVTEIPASSTTPASASASASGSSASASYLNFYNKSQGQGTDTPKKASLLGVEKELETPLSPGFGELASLLQEAAWLEFSLEKGELPDDVKKEESGVQEEEEEGKEKESQKDKEAAARAKVEEERKKHAAVAKARAKQEEKESKSNSGPGAFRNTLLRTKSGHKREESTDSQLRKEPVRSKSLPFRPLPTPPSQPSTPSKTTTTVSTPKKEVAPSISSSIDREDKNSNSTLSLSSQTSPKSPTRYFSSLRRFASSSKTSLVSASLPRDSVSASSEDSSGIPTPPGNGGDASAEGRNGLFGWPSLSPKRSPGVGRSASFTDKIFNRGKKTSSASNEGDAASAYEAIDRLGKSKAGKSATSLIPPLDTASFSLDVPVIHENDQPLPSPQELVSPRRSASLYVPATSQFPPVYSARPTSSVYTSIPLLSENGSKPSRTLASVDEDQLASPPFATDPSIQPHGIDAALFSAKPTSPVYTPHFSQIPKEMQSDTPVTSKTPHRPHDAGLFSVKPTSPVYTPHTSAFAMRSEDTITDSPLLRPNPDGDRPDSWMSETSRDSSASSIPSPFFDSFPPVPEEFPLPPALPSRQRNFNKPKPSIPLPPTPSFFESAPSLSSAAVGAEFSVGNGPSVRSASVKSKPSNR